MKYVHLCSILIFGIIFNCKNTPEKIVEVASDTANDLHTTTTPNDLSIIPIQHASLILADGDHVVYIDPVGDPKLYKSQESPDIVLITDIHPDHFEPKTLESLDLENCVLVVPQAVKNIMPDLRTKETIVMSNGETKEIAGLSIEAIPMYNLREEALKFHKKGRGNGYILTIDDQRVYISGDTEDIPEMRHLKNIDIAFVCMNMPYTMTVDNAASAVLDFKPKKVYPYHYKGNNGLSDVDKFKSLVNKTNPDIEVIQLDWYQ